MSFQLMRWSYVAAVLFTAYNIVRFIIGPGKWIDG